MIYYIIDVRFPNAFRRSSELDSRSNGHRMEKFELPFLYHFVYPNQSIRTIVRETRSYIFEYLNKKGLGVSSLDMIRLCGHGDSGYLEIGEGLTESNAQEFSPLAMFMKSDLSPIGLEIHGCGVGSDTSILEPGKTINNPICVPGSTQNGGKGLNLLKKLAKAINRKVKAGLNCQYVTRFDNWTFEGSTITVTPDGNSWLR